MRYFLAGVLRPRGVLGDVGRVAPDTRWEGD